MPINKALITLVLLTFTISSSVVAQKANKRNRPITPRPVISYNHPTLDAPPGMVYIKGGTTSIKYDQASTDSNANRKVSLTSFFIDKTEVTNQQYRQFINWVVDSIAIVKYIKDDKYFIEIPAKDGKKDEKNEKSEPATAPATAAVTDTNALNNATPAPIDTTNKTASVTDTSKPADTSIVRKRINWAKINHNKIFNSKDEDIKSKIAPMLDENGNVKKEMYVFSYTYVKPATSTSNNSKKNQYKTVPVNIYPNENVWTQDLTNSQTDLYVENYFKAAPFNDYPVVGVDWVQANAFAYWRSLVSTNYYNMPSYMKHYKLIYTLPSEAQWVYAAEGFYDMISAPDTLADTVATLVTTDTLQTPHDSAYVANLIQQQEAKKPADSVKRTATVKDRRAAERKAAKLGNYYLSDYMKVKFTKYGGKYSNKMPDGTDNFGPFSDSTIIHRDPNGMLENFKQEEGNYWEDGAALTTPVMSFAPNEFGLYNMEGNVAEWVMDAYSPATYAFVADINPVLLYDADSTDADAMKRKVVRGGSFIGNAQSLTPYYRDLELQNVSHCFVGFRCVVQAPEILFKNVATRNKTIRGKQTKGKLSKLKLPEIR